MKFESFLAHAVRLEHESEKMYRKAVEVIDAQENPEAAAFFLEMAGYAKLHFDEVFKHAGYVELSQLPESGYQWGEDAAPESLSPFPKADEIIDLDSAMTRALEAERRSALFYESVARSSTDPAIKALADDFSAEERSHVLALERFMGLKPY